MKEDVSNLLITCINLCITDLLITLLVMTSSLGSLIDDKWLFGMIWCEFVSAINYCLIIVSMLTLCFISMDRYQAVLHPLQYHIRMTKQSLYTDCIFLVSRYSIRKYSIIHEMGEI